MSSPADTRQVGMPTALALVIGGMIGSGVFMLPASLAPYRGVSLIGWMVSAGGSVMLALVFARLARVHPVTGGPYAYTRRAFGDFAGFLVGWGYWISCWTTNGALSVAFVGYLDPFFPTLVRNPATAGLMAVATVWLLTYVNSRGVRAAGQVQVTTTILKVLPLLLIGFAGLAAFAPAHFVVAETSASALGRDVVAVVTLTLWAFLGLETATIPAGSVRDAARVIPRATVLGTLAAAAIYIVSTVGVMSVVPPETLAATTAPFADAARALFGDAAALVVAAGAAISCFGALNAWVLLVGQMPMAMAHDGLFPEAFGRLSPRGTPTRGMIIGATLTTALIATNYTQGLVALFTFIILLATLSVLVPYAFCSLAVFAGRASDAPLSRGGAAIAVLAFVYAMVAIGGAGADTVYWGFLLLLLGLPVYVWVKRQRGQGRSA
ncbi:MAG TPA: amino acid permease [Vicinamibacterales bacterium]|nr:amino acid permease [Vicinamibacterales bacterium]